VFALALLRIWGTQPILGCVRGKVLWEDKGLNISVLNMENGCLHNFACQRFVY
jgi:hypothetical protein